MGGVRRKEEWCGTASGSVCRASGGWEWSWCESVPELHQGHFHPQKHGRQNQMPSLSSPNTRCVCSVRVTGNGVCTDRAWDLGWGAARPAAARQEHPPARVQGVASQHCKASSMPCFSAVTPKLMILMSPHMTPPTPLHPTSITPVCPGVPASWCCQASSCQTQTHSLLGCSLSASHGILHVHPSAAIANTQVLSCDTPPPPRHPPTHPPTHPTPHTPPDLPPLNPTHTPR